MQSTDPPRVPPDHNRGPFLLALQSSTLGIPIIVVLLRVYMRLKLKAHSWEDYTIYFALVPNPPTSYKTRLPDHA